MSATTTSVLDRLCDPAQLREELQCGLPAFAEGRLRIDTLSIERIRRSASIRRHPHPITLSVRAMVTDTRTARSGEQRLYCKLYRDGAGAAACARIDPATLVAPAFGDALSHVPALDMLVWALPNDPVLTQLPQLLSGGCRGGALHAHAEMRRYEPEARASIRVTSHEGSASPAWGKTFADDRGRTVHARLREAWRLAKEDGRAPLVAEPLGYDRATQTVWQREVQGTPLGEVVNGSAAGEAFFEVGRALASFHAAGLPTAQVQGPTHGLHECRRRAAKVGRAAPELAGMADEVLSHLRAAGARLRHPVPCAIHGDFHVDQVLVIDGRVLFFDLDEVAIGDPMEDLAALAVRVEADGRLSRDAAANALDRLAAGYAAGGAAGLRRDTLDWHIAIQWLLQASRAFVFQRPGWRHALERHLLRARDAAVALQPRAVGRQPVLTESGDA